ncbi:Gti1/Pac2 family-domain-containing protein [Gilbertella persicaria]|uniref:Gti1/Pac2 family-domain-containing protein n=1 Tax=Gilbertella persicaria TaxID=101096 RepID=UPI00222035A1|nr:Gti1/Pac2 family-domain-containing protein [Gilbertella persicaria]KAI8058648.1 Gti1/Pac2 family-domain-containing protein [Gilbertella persicaria]
METYVGYIKTPQDALYVFEACRKGKLNRVQRRLTSKERINIRSGSVFAWDEREAGMRRWTDGRTWSPSRVLGSFLTYKELDTKRRPRRPSVPLPGGGKQITFSYKQNGLIKQSFSICTAANQKIHLISYYTKADILSGRLQRPSHDPLLNSIDIPKGLYPELNPLDIGGGHPASIHSIQYHRHDSIDSSSSDISTSHFSPHLKPVNYVLPAQDIAWERLPSTEDRRQLNALRDLVRI